MEKNTYRVQNEFGKFLASVLCEKNKPREIRRYAAFPDVLLYGIGNTYA